MESAKGFVQKLFAIEQENAIQSSMSTDAICSTATTSLPCISISSGTPTAVATSLNVIDSLGTKGKVGASYAYCSVNQYCCDPSLCNPVLSGSCLATSVSGNPYGTMECNARCLAPYVNVTEASCPCQYCDCGQVCSESRSSGLSGGEIAAIIFGIFFVIAAIVFFYYYIQRKNLKQDKPMKKNKTMKKSKMDGESDTPYKEMKDK